jgi:hypothetical protein
MENKNLLMCFSQHNECFKKGLETLKREAIANSYKTNLIGLETFIANCELSQEMENFYKLCILAE